MLWCVPTTGLLLGIWWSPLSLVVLLPQYIHSHTLAPDSCASPAARVGEGRSQFSSRSRRYISYKVIVVSVLSFSARVWFEEVRRVRSIVNYVSLACRILKAVEILPCPADRGAGSPQSKAFSASPSCS